MTSPTREQIVEAHSALAHLIFYATAEADMEKVLERGRLIRKFLPPIPPIPQPTMADVEWDDDKHFLAEAEFDGYGPSIMLWETTSECISVIREGRVWAARPEELTPTGRRYTLTEVETHAG